MKKQACENALKTKERNERPELVPYMHGCLAQLVGDEGYYDDRSDVPEL